MDYRVMDYVLKYTFPVIFQGPTIPFVQAQRPVSAWMKRMVSPRNIAGKVYFNTD